MAWHIREANSDAEAPLLADIVRRSFRDVAERFGLTAENCPTHPSFCTADSFRDAQARGTVFYIAEEDGLPVGCVGLEPASEDGCHLVRLAVLLEHRRRGVGAGLVERVRQEARRRGLTKVGIALIAEHTELRRWYEKLGFRATETRQFEHLPFKVLFMSAEA